MNLTPRGRGHGGELDRVVDLHLGDVDGDLLGDLGRQRLDGDLAGDVLEHAALRTPGAWSAALELDRDLGLDLLVEADLEAVEVQDLTAHRVVLLLLDHDRDRLGAVDLEVEQRVALREQDAEVAGGDLEGAGLAALAVDDAGNEALPAQASGRPRAEVVARRNLECGSVCAMALRDDAEASGYARAPG